MSDGTVPTVGDVRRVLVVGDSGPTDTVLDSLSAQADSISLVRERSLSNGLDRLSHLEIHCVVCQFEADSRDPSLIEYVRDGDETVPIIAIADDSTRQSALEAGATDIVTTDDPDSLVATRVRNAAERYRLETTSSHRDRSILDGSDALVWVLETDATIQYASAAVEHRMGYTPAELERTSLSELVHPDDCETVTSAVDTVVEAPIGATEHVSARIGHADGTWNAYELTCRNQLAASLGAGIVLTFSAATPPETAADSPVQSALERIDAPLFTLGPQDAIRETNSAAARLFKTDRSRAVGTVVWTLLDDTVRGKLYERVHEARATGSPVEFETPSPSLETRLAVTVYPGEHRNEIVTVYAREAPEAPETTAAAIDRERFELLESVVDALDDGIAVLDGSTIEFPNRTLVELADVETLVGQELTDLFDTALAETIRDRTQSPVARWTEPVTGTLTASDPSRAVDVFVMPLSGDERTLCVVRDRTHSPAGTLSTLEAAITAIWQSDHRSGVTQTLLETVIEITDADLAGWYRPEAGVLRPDAVATAAASSPAELQPIDRSSAEVIDHLEPDEDTGDTDAVTITVFDRSERDSLVAQLGIRAERLLVLSIPDHGIVLATSTDPMAFAAVDRTPLTIVSQVSATALEGLEYESMNQTSQATLTRLETAVDRCQRLREIEHELLAGDTRDEIEQTLCDALCGRSLEESAGSIDRAWVGHVDTGSEQLVPDTWAGYNGDPPASVPVPPTSDETADSPASADSVRSLAPGDTVHPAAHASSAVEPVVVNLLDSNDTAQFEREWHRRARDRGIQSILALPLVTEGVCYGTLTLVASHPSVFADQTREQCAQLAAVASDAIAAVERKRALLADHLTELEIQTRDDADPLAAIAGQMDQRVTIQTVVPRSAGGTTVYCTVPDGEAVSIPALTDAVPALESGRLVGAQSTDSLLEFVLTETSIADSLASHGGILRSVTPVDDRTRLIVAVPDTVDVRSILTMVERVHADAQLIARRDHDRSPQPSQSFDSAFRTHLSDRQRRTLEAAYYSGFFEWPRERTGEEVAESVGVSQPTFSRHLRVAQAKLFGLVFDESAIDT